MIETMVCGLVGAAVGVLLYRLGVAVGRRTRGVTVAGGERPSGGMAPLSGRELYNFLNYDGGEMPREDENKR